MGQQSQTFVGNGKKIDVSSNTGLLTVVGNNCFVTVTKNEGEITITGNKNHIQANENIGNIRYTGNNGLIEVGKTCKGIGQVFYTGNGGVVRRLKNKSEGGEKCSASKSSSKNSSKSSTPHEPKHEQGAKVKKQVQSELRVNGVEVRINRKSMKVNSVNKDSEGQTKQKRSSCQVSMNSKPDSNMTKINVNGVKVEIVNMNNFELENYCLNLATGLPVVVL